MTGGDHAQLSAERNADYCYYFAAEAVQSMCRTGLGRVPFFSHKISFLLINLTFQISLSDGILPK